MKRPRPNRRDVLRGTAALSVPLLTGCRVTDVGAAAVALPRGEPRRGPLKIGLVGCGGRGRGAAGQALRAGEHDVAGTDTATLWAAADVFPEQVDGALSALGGALGEERAHQLDVPEERRFVGFDAYEKVIASGVDVVLLATPPGFRPAHLDAAVRAGLHVFCEKPMAVDSPGVRSVMASAERAREQGTSLVSGFCWRYKGGHRAFFERLHDGAIGDLTAVYTNYNTGAIGTRPRQDGWSDIEWQLRNWHHFDWLSGSHAVEQACHSLDMQAWAFQDRTPLSITAVGGCTTRSGPERGNCFDNHSAVFDYADGAKAFHMCRQWANTDGENNDYFFGSLGKGWLENWTPRYEFDGRRAWRYEGPTDDDMYQNEHDELFAAIRSGRPRNDGDWMATSTLLAIALRMAATTGKRVSWDQALESEQRLGPESLTWGEYEPAPMPVPGVTPLV